MGNKELPDLTGVVDIDENNVPVCPLCGYLINYEDSYDPCLLRDTVFLAHESCISEAIE